MSYTANKQANDVIEFWFSQETSAKWFTPPSDFDQQIAERFGALIDKVGKGETSDWREDVYGRLAEIIVLDQFSRNVYRDTPKAFLYDDVALILSQEIIQQIEFDDLPQSFQKFAAMPFMHSESAVIHKQAVEIFQMIGDETAYDFELKHKAIIDRFGRYPHRNAILGRQSSAEELAFLEEPNSSF